MEAPFIIMPKRPNSFAHEWGHALDFHLMDKFGGKEGRGLIQVIRNIPKDVASPLADTPEMRVMCSPKELFFRIDSLFPELAERNKHGDVDPEEDAAERALQRPFGFIHPDRQMTASDCSAHAASFWGFSAKSCI